MDALLIDDDARALARASQLFEGAGFGVVSVHSAQEALDRLEERDFALVLSDHWLPGTNGAELLRTLRSGPRNPPVILMSERPATPTVVRALKDGAAYYLEKPLDAHELQQAVRTALGDAEPPGAFTEADEPPSQEDPLPELVGVSNCILNVKQLVLAASRTVTPVFIQGPTGTGKELVARSIHRLSARAGAAFVPVNCGALPEGLAESELFGAEKGAFTGAAAARKGLVRAAEGGTLFLDELGEMPMDLQVKMLRVLQEKAVRSVGSTREEPIDVRVLAATNRDPEAAVRSGKLREDLYYRLVVLRITLAPLASRPEDVAPLCSHALESLRERYGGGPTSVSGAALEALRRYGWPGNVRELQNTLDLVFALGEAKEVIQLEHLPERIRAANPEGAEPPASGAVPEPAPSPERERPMMALREAEQMMIQQALASSGGNKAQAARMLGISRQALYRRLEALDIKTSDT